MHRNFRKDLFRKVLQHIPPDRIAILDGSDDGITQDDADAIRGYGCPLFVREPLRPSAD